MTYSVQLTLKSRNAKVGAMPVSTSAALTCADSCPLQLEGCYAKAGPLGMMWAKLSSAAPGSYYAVTGGQAYAHDWQSFTQAIAELPEDTAWRHNQAGDLPGKGDEIDEEALGQLVEANRGKRGFTYSHKPITIAANFAAIAHANANGFTINLSADTLAKADTLAAANIGPVAAVLPVDLERGYSKKAKAWTEELDAYRARVADIATPEGRKVVVCPATYRDDVSCKSCMLCQKVARKVIVGFPAHGASKRKASKVAEA